MDENNNYISLFSYDSNKISDEELDVIVDNFIDTITTQAFELYNATKKDMELKSSIKSLDNEDIGDVVNNIVSNILSTKIIYFLMNIEKEKIDLHELLVKNIKNGTLINLVVEIYHMELNDEESILVDKYCNSRIKKDNKVKKKTKKHI